MTYDTVIIGSGISGLTSAISLAGSGQKVVILEAQDYIGGRTKSVVFEESELCFNEGAHWFHGGDLNPFFQWARARYDLGPMAEDRLETQRRDFYQGRDITDDLVAETESFFSTYEILCRKTSKDITVADVLAELKSQRAPLFASFMTQLWMSADRAEQVSLKDFLDDPLGIGGWQMDRGLSHLVDCMAREAISNGAEIETNRAVVSVTHRDDGVDVRTADGKVYHAKCAIVTTSVGVLKSGDILFDADVKASVDEALSGVTMGAFFKTGMALDPDYLSGLKIKPDSFIRLLDEDNPRLLCVRAGGKPVIVMMTGGAQAREMETWGKARVRTFFVEALNETGLFPDVEKHIRGDIAMTAWSANPFVRGAYSFKVPEGKKSGPLKTRRIIFAGEAWLARADESPGQIAGAWRSAMQAVEMAVS